MNDTTYTASLLDTHRAADLVRQTEMMRVHRERAESAAAAASAADPGTHGHRAWWPHRAARRTTFATR